jgi:DNA gyrase/topoisomerase IV subunit A
LLKTGKIDYDNIYPDYPTGGIIVNKDAISEIYKTGRGQVILRGRAEIVGNFIQITELPYQVYA